MRYKGPLREITAAWEFISSNLHTAHDSRGSVTFSYLVFNILNSDHSYVRLLMGKQVKRGQVLVMINFTCGRLTLRKWVWRRKIIKSCPDSWVSDQHPLHVDPDPGFWKWMRIWMQIWIQSLTSLQCQSKKNYVLYLKTNYNFLWNCQQKVIVIYF